MFAIRPMVEQAEAGSILDIPSVSQVDLWLVADYYRWDKKSYDGKVLKRKLDFVMALDDVESSFTTCSQGHELRIEKLTLSTTIAMCGRCMQGISLNSISERQVPLTYRTWVGFAATCLFLGICEYGVFGCCCCCWCWICDSLELSGSCW